MPDYGGAGDDTAKDIKSTAAVGVIYNNWQSYPEVGPLFPKTRNIRNASAFRKTRNSLMDVYSASVARLVSLALAVYCTAHYNEKNLHTENFGQILRILGMAKWKSS